MKYVYLCEGECEKQLIMALQVAPGLIVQGTSRVLNVVQNKIPSSLGLKWDRNTVVVFVFDTDVQVTDQLKKNIETVRKKSEATLVTVGQVLTLEDELVRCTDVSQVIMLTKSTGIKNFKSDFNRKTSVECRKMLDRHEFDIQKLWCKDVPGTFSGIVMKEGKKVKI